MSTHRIFRYRLEITDAQDIAMPAGAWLLSVGPPRDGMHHLDLWAAVDTTQPEATRSIRIVGTGNPLPDDLGRFIGTVPTDDGMFVWHVFEAAE